MNFKKIAEEIGQTVTEKNAAYGNSMEVCGEFLKLLYPDGLPTREYQNALLLVRIFDKQMRIANNAHAFGESPFRDIAGYGICGAAIHDKQTIPKDVLPEKSNIDFCAEPCDKCPQL